MSYAQANIDLNRYDALKSRNPMVVSERLAFQRWWIELFSKPSLRCSRPSSTRPSQRTALDSGRVEMGSKR